MFDCHWDIAGENFRVNITLIDDKRIGKKVHLIGQRFGSADPNAWPFTAMEEDFDITTHPCVQQYWVCFDGLGKRVLIWFHGFMSRYAVETQPYQIHFVLIL